MNRKICEKRVALMDCGIDIWTSIAIDVCGTKSGTGRDRPHVVTHSGCGGM
jgi:hypothetical protein